MNLKLDYHSSEPLYRQAVLEIKRLVVSKQLLPGDKLPSLRALAEQLQLNATTIRRIIDQLAQDGVVVQRHGSGVFIAGNEVPFSHEYVQKNTARQATVYLIEGLRLGLDLADLQNILVTQHRHLMKENEA